MISLISAWHPDEAYIERFLNFYASNRNIFSDLVLICNGHPNEDLLNLLQIDQNIKLSVILVKDFSLFWNSAVEKCQEDWVLLLAPDELLDQKALEELQTIKFDDNKIYCFSRQNLFENKFYENVFPIETQERLFHYQDRWKNAIHEVIDTDKERIILNGVIKHNSYQSWAHVFNKSKTYIPLEAARYGLLKLTAKSVYMVFRETKALPVYLKDGLFGLKWYSYSVFFWMRVLMFRIGKIKWN